MLAIFIYVLSFDDSNRIIHRTSDSIQNAIEWLNMYQNNQKLQKMSSEHKHLIKIITKLEKIKHELNIYNS